MSLSSLSIQRPVLAIVMSVTIVLFGIIGYTFLGVREYPSVDPPIITVTTNYTGANSDIIESQITEPLEELINGIEGIRTLTSVSRDGRSTITVEFDVSSDMEAASNDVRDKVSQAVSKLPNDCDPPIVTKADADASPIIMLYVGSKSRSLLEITDIATNVIKERLQTLPGVSQVMIWGEKKYSMRLWFDPAKMSAMNVTPIDVRNALAKENVELPSGKIEGHYTELSIRTLGRLTTPEEFNNLIIRQDDISTVRMKDIGFAELYPENDRYLFRRNDIPMVGCAIVPLPGSNHIEISDGYYKRFEEIKKDIPEDINLELGFDTTQFIRNSIDEVKETILLAFALVILIIFLFLREWRTTLIPIIAIPISLIGAFFIMYLANFSINVLTLLGVVLAIGIVVDDAIVVLENIYAKVETGMPALQAAIAGSKEIFFAIISTTISLASVFLPVIFIQGFTGKLFREFGIVIAGSVMISAFVALTLTPMMSAKFLSKIKGHGKFYHVSEPFFNWMTSKYKSALEGFMSHRWLSFIIIAASSAILVYLGATLPSELAPLEDRSMLRLSMTGPEGASFTFMDRNVRQLTRMNIDSITEAKSILSMTSPVFGASSAVNSAMSRIILCNPQERKRTQQDISKVLSRNAAKFNDIRTFVIQEQTIGTNRGGLPVQYVLNASTLEKLRQAIPQFLDSARNDKTFQMVDVNLRFNKPEIDVVINREKARQIGVSTDDIAQTLQLALSEQRYGYFTMEGKQYQVTGTLLKRDRDKPADLNTINVRAKDGSLVQLANLVTMSEVVTPPQLYHFNRYISATVSASLAPGKTIGDGIAAMDRIATKTLDDNISTALTGPSQDFQESSSSLYFSFLLAIILIYLTLAAQFESFRDPLIIMFTVPLAIAGALLSLWYFSQTMNIFSQIGMIMLIGLVTKNGILIVEFANQRKQTGLDRMEAVIGAATARFRPILMTSLSTILGTLPIALALGAGSGSRVSMGIAVIGGLVFSTLLTLFVIPAMYSYLSSKKAKTEYENI
jgi:multidrug efflux pump